MMTMSPLTGIPFKPVAAFTQLSALVRE